MFCRIALMLSLLTASANAADPSHNYSLDEIAEALLHAESQFTDIQIDFSTVNTTQAGVRSESTGRYAKRASDGAELISVTETDVDVKTGERKPGVDRISAFRQGTTTSLNRIPTARGPRAVLSPGRSDKDFMDESPHEMVWAFTRTQTYSGMLKHEGSAFRVEGTETVDGLQTVKVGGTIADGKIAVTLWVCPERGYLVVRNSFRRATDEAGVDRILTDLVQLSNGMWYAKTITRVAPKDPNWRIVQTVSKVSADPLPDAAFQIDFPANTHVTDQVLQRSYTIMPSDPLANVSDWPSSAPQDMKSLSVTETKLNGFVEAAGREQPPAATPPAEASAGFRLWWLAMPGALAVVIGGALLGLRMRKSRLRQP